MSTIRTLAQLRTEALQRADIDPSSDFLDTTTGGEVDRYINESIRELYDLIIESGAQEFYVTQADVTMDGTGLGALPSDFYLGHLVEYKESDTAYYPLEPISLRSAWKMQDSAGWHSGSPSMSSIKYRFMGDFVGGDGDHIQVIFYYPASSTGTLRVWYIPRPPTLDADSDTWNGFNGWEEYVIIDVALKILEKEQNPATDPLMIRKAQLVERIKFLGAQQDHGFPEVIEDVEDGGWW